ncbi:(S)-ureidoglycine aminohydrolase, cupin domain [Dillenia turbinata]|uniref:(S)-ureidoglycine aminohydrolase, cupin domain n=1 Tax=Dillenia turbinata TaxID=194707 RepID=A0AAN8VUJ2_9MAGN
MSSFSLVGVGGASSSSAPDCYLQCQNQKPKTKFPYLTSPYTYRSRRSQGGRFLSLCFVNSGRYSRSRFGVKAETETMATEKLGIKIVKNPPESKLSELGVRKWPKWGCPPSNFPWTYTSKETCYLLKGKVKVYPDGSDEAVEIEAGDLVEFPKGMKCTWDVSVAVHKHYNFE